MPARPPLFCNRNESELSLGQLRERSPTALDKVKPPPAPRSVIAIKSDAPESYLVAKDDTLWDIASRFLKAPSRESALYLSRRRAHALLRRRQSLFQVAGESHLCGTAIRLSPRVRAQPLERDDIRLPTQSIQQFITRPRILSMRELDAAPISKRSRRSHDLRQRRSSLRGQPQTFRQATATAWCGRVNL
jgi:hypothetical protein